MARTIDEIQDKIISNLTNPALNPDLNGLQIASKTSIIGWLVYIFALTSNTLETLWDRKEAELDAKIGATIIGTARWYQAVALAFQYNYSLIWDNYKYVYDPIDPAARIVVYCAVNELSLGGLRIKVAKTGRVALDPSELLALNSYLSKVKMAGTNVIATSAAADLMAITYTIYYDPQHDLQVVKASVINNVQNYIANLPFDGRFKTIHLEDAIQAATGVNNFQQSSIQAKYGGFPYQAIDIEYRPDAGYLELDALSSIFFDNSYSPLF